MVSTTAQPLRASSRIACHRSRLEQGSIPELGSSCRKDGAGVRGAHRGDALREQRGPAGSPRPAACSLLGLREPAEPPALQRLRPQRNAPFVWQQRITCNFRGLTLSPSVEAAALRVGATSERRPWTERRIPVPFAVGSSGRASRESLGSRPPRGRRRREPSETWLRAGGTPGASAARRGDAEAPRARATASSHTHLAHVTVTATAARPSPGAPKGPGAGLEACALAPMLIMATCGFSRGPPQRPVDRRGDHAHGVGGRCRERRSQPRARLPPPPPRRLCATGPCGAGRGRARCQRPERGLESAVLRDRHTLVFIFLNSGVFKRWVCVKISPNLQLDT